MRRVDQFWWVLLACAVVMTIAAGMGQGCLDVINWTVEWTSLTTIMERDFYKCGMDLYYSDCQAGDWIGYKGNGEFCCVKETKVQLGLRSDGVVVWRDLE